LRSQNVPLAFGPEQQSGPPILEGWLPPQRYDSPLALEPQSPTANRLMDTMQELRARYGEDNVVIGQGYNGGGEPDDRYMSVYLREGAKPQGPAKRVARWIGARLFS